MSRAEPIIAIVEDDDSVRRAIARLLRTVKMRAESFASGEDFLRAAAAPTYHLDCVILDVQMPGMTGPEVQDWLNETGSRLPVIFITAHNESALRQRVLEAGAQAFLQKPFDQAVLLEAVEKALSRENGGP